MSTTTEPLPTCHEHLTGAGFQDLIDPRLAWLKQERLMAVDKPGVFAIPVRRFADGTVQARLIASLPDYQGVFMTPQVEVVFDAKVCSQSSFDLSKYRIEQRKARSRQLRFMYERASFGSACFFLIHWNRRVLKTKADPAVTYAFPVRENHPFWQAFETGSEKSIKRSHCETYAVEVGWTCNGQERIKRPDILRAAQAVSIMNRGRSRGGWE